MRRWTIPLLLTTFAAVPAAMTFRGWDSGALRTFLGPHTILALMIPVGLLTGAWFIREDARARPFQAVGQLWLLAVVFQQIWRSEGSLFIALETPYFLAVSAMGLLDLRRAEASDPERIFTVRLLLLLAAVELLELAKLAWLPFTVNLSARWIALSLAYSTGTAAFFALPAWGLRRNMSWAPWVGGLAVAGSLLLEVWGFARGVRALSGEWDDVLLIQAMMTLPALSVLAATAALLARHILRARIMASRGEAN